MFEYFKDNWKQIVHLLLGTYRFGVNNEWWCEYHSMFGIPFYKRTPRRIVQNYRMAKFRTIYCYFVSSETAKILFPKYMEKLDKKKILEAP